MKVFLAMIVILLLGFSLEAQEKTSTKVIDKKSKIVYKYKKYEKFDFENLNIDAATGNPGDLSVSPQYKVRFKNDLPYRRNFNSEIRKGIDRIK